MSKTIVLTGAGGVLCSTLAVALAKEGHKIAVLDLHPLVDLLHRS